MSVINVNSFESRVSNKNFLSNYTDPYLKQSLANLGQRLSVKGDSIVSGKFLVSELFTNYLGDFGATNRAIEFTYDKENNQVNGKVVDINSKTGARTIAGGDGNNSESTATITIGSTNNILQNLTKDDYPSEIYLTDSNGVNGSSYWHLGSAKICRTYDSAIGKDVLIYKIVGHHDAGNYGEYDNEFICEEITVDGEFVDGFRIFMSNEENLMIRERDIDDTTQFADGEYEKLVMMRLHKEDKQWKLSCYKANSHENEIGDVTSVVDDDIWNKIYKNYDSDGSSYPSTLISDLVDAYTEVNIAVTGDGSALFEYCYTIDVNENDEENVGWIVKSFSGKTSKEMCDNVGTNPTNDDYDDNTLIEQKLEYFTNDVTEIFPIVLNVYDEVMYRDDSNIKLKRQIMSQLVLQLMSDASKQNGAVSSETVSEYSIIMPVDLQVNYNLNSNDSSIIYNTLSPVSVSFLKLGTDDNPEPNIVDSLSKIWNDVDDDNNKIENTQIIFADGYESKTAQYDFIIKYINDNVISQITWTPTFVLPYIDSKGFWVVNDIRTDQYARSTGDENGSIVIINCDDPNSFNPSSDIILGSEYLCNLSSDNWNKKEFDVQYTDNEVNVGGGIKYKMSAWVPSDSLLKEISNTDDFSYINGCLFMCTSTMSMEVKDEYMSNSLSDTLGSDSRVTSFWVATEVNDDNNKYWEMKCLTIPGQSTALDFSWLMSLPNYIKHYATSAFTPDNYKHRWLVFNEVDVNLKNNTKDNTKNIHPVIRNYDSTYFSATLSSVTRSFGSYFTDNVIKDSKDREQANKQYKNNYNFSIEFTDGVKTENDVITSTNNSLKGRHFGIEEFTYTYQDPIAYISVDENGNQVVKVSKKDVTKKYGAIPDSIHYALYDNEWTPNGKYDANDDDKSSTYQYPILDLAEMLGRNFNVLNRYNVIGIDNKTFQTGENKTVLWNAYFGVDWNGDTDKSHLKIGTSNVNPNLGTSTMVSIEDQKKMTKVETFDVDISYINLNGDTNVSGVLRTAYQTWNSTDATSALDISGGKLKDDKITTWSSIMTPVGVVKNYEHTEFFTDGKAKTDYAYNAEENNYLFTVHTYNVESSKYEYKNQSKYYKNDNEESKKYSKSYLNVTKLLNDNHIDTDYRTIFSGDLGRLTTRYSDKNNFDGVLELANLQGKSVGVFEDTYNAFLVDGKTTKDLSPNLDWVKWYEDNNMGTLSDWETIFKSNEKYIKKTEGYNYTWQDSKDCVKCNAISNKEDVQWFGNHDIPGGYERTKSGSALFVDTIGLKKYDANVWLELSTDLTNRENYITTIDNNANKKVAVGNPIQISYVDVPFSYVGQYTISSLSRIYTYMYVDGSYNQFKYEVSEDGELPTDAWKYAYNEVWTCDGCEKCTQYSCSMIGMCNKSKVEGSYVMSYGFFRASSDAMVDTYLSNNVYKYMHERYGHNQDGSTYLYGVLTYYPSMTVSYLYNKDASVRRKALEVEMNGKKWMMKNDGNFYPYTNSSIEVVNNDNDVPDWVFVGKNLLCDFQDDWIMKNAPTLGDDYSYSYSTGDSLIVMRYNGSDITKNDLTCEIDSNLTYWKYPKAISGYVTSSGQNTYYDWYTTKTDVLINKDKYMDGYMRFSYYQEVEDHVDFQMTYRYVNVREILTNHSVPEFYNGKLYTITDNGPVEGKVEVPEVDIEYSDNKASYDSAYADIPHTSTTFTYLSVSPSYINGVVDEENRVMTLNGEKVDGENRFEFTVDAWTSSIEDRYQFIVDGNSYYWKKIPYTEKEMLSYSVNKNYVNELGVDFTYVGQNIYTSNFANNSYTYEMSVPYKIWDDKSEAKNYSNREISGNIKISLNGNKEVTLPIDIKYTPRTTALFDLGIYPNNPNLSSYSENKNNVGLKFTSTITELEISVESCKHTFIDDKQDDLRNVFCDVFEEETGNRVSNYYSSELVRWEERDGHKYALYAIKKRKDVPSDTVETWVVQQREHNVGEEAKKWTITITSE